MIYLFKNIDNSVNIVYSENTLTENDKQNAIVVESIPEQIHKPGFYEVLRLDKNNVPYWEYVEHETLTPEKLLLERLISVEQYKKLTGKDPE